MSTAEALYSARIAFPEYLVRGRAQTASLELYRSGALVAPTSGTFALYDPSNTAIVSASAVTITSSIATYPILAASLPSTLALGHGYREEWALLGPDGVTRTWRRDAAVVLHAAYPVITDDDLTAVYSNLTDQLSASTTTFQAKIDEAWKRILGRLEMQGVFPEHVVTNWSLREVHLELTYHLIFLDFHGGQGGRWAELADQHKKEFELAWGRLKFVKGTSTTGTADSDRMTTPNKGVTYVNASPRTSWRGFGGM